MKARLIVAICLLTLSVGLAVFSMFHLYNCADELTYALETTMQSAALQSPNWPGTVDELQRVWDRHSSFFHIMQPHINLNELEWVIGSLKEYQQRGDVALFIEQCVRGLQCVKTIRDTERPNWGNIF